MKIEDTNDGQEHGAQDGDAAPAATVDPTAALAALDLTVARFRQVRDSAKAALDLAWNRDWLRDAATTRDAQLLERHREIVDQVTATLGGLVRLEADVRTARASLGGSVDLDPADWCPPTDKAGA